MIEPLGSSLDFEQDELEWWIFDGKVGVARLPFCGFGIE